MRPVFRIRIGSVAARRGTGTAFALLALALGPACANCVGGPGWPGCLWDEHARLVALLAREAGAPPQPGALRVRLAFGTDVDLDLQVTDPGGERISLQNPRAGSGGRLEADVDCEWSGPRIETIVFREAPPGRYRIGIDFPQRCDDEYAAAAFVVVVEEAGRREERRGTIAPRHTYPNVLEFERTGGGSPAQ